MLKRRQIFEAFTKAELVKISEDLGFKGWAVLNKGDIVGRLTRKRSIGMDEVLNYLGYSDLISLCSKLGLNTSGRSKQVLIDRILGQENKRKPKQKKIFKPDKPKEKKPKRTVKKKQIPVQPTKTVKRNRKKMAEAKKNNNSGEPIEKQLWKAADKLRKNIDAAEYKHIVLGLIFLKYISDAFEGLFEKLKKGDGEYAGADPEDKDEYKAENVFFVPEIARWS